MTGPIEPDDLGATLMHEHVRSVVPGGFYSGGDLESRNDMIIQTFRVLSTLGVGAVVDLTGRPGPVSPANRSLLAQLSEELGIHVIAGFALYKDPWMGIDETEDGLTRRFVDSVDPGIDGVRAGIFGEIGTSLDRITPNEELQLIAAARAHAETGVAISTHCTLGTMAVEQAAILESNGADLSRVVLGHLDLMPDVDHLTRVLDTGANIAFDTFGKEWFDYQVPGSRGPGGEPVKHTYHRPDRDRIAAMTELCRRGLDDKIVLSCDMSGAEAWLNPTTHGTYGYSYLFEAVIPELRDSGVSNRSIERMLVSNPARILAIP